MNTRRQARAAAAAAAAAFRNRAPRPRRSRKRQFASHAFSQTAENDALIEPAVLPLPLGSGPPVPVVQSQAQPQFTVQQATTLPEQRGLQDPKDDKDLPSLALTD